MVQTYWLIVAPGVLFGLSLIGWLALWTTERDAMGQARVRGWRVAAAFVVVPVVIAVVVLVTTPYVWHHLPEAAAEP